MCEKSRLTGENKDVYRKKRVSNAYHLLVPLFSSFTGSVVCHTLSLFGKSPFGIISSDFLYDSFTRALPLLSFPVLSAFTLFSFESSAHLSIFGISHAARAGARDNTRMRYKLLMLRSFIKRDGSAHIMQSSPSSWLE